MTPFDISELNKVSETHAGRRRRRSKKSRTVRRWAKRLRRANWLLVGLGIIAVALALFMGGLILTVNARSQVNRSWLSVDRALIDISNKPGAELTLNDFNLLQISVAELNQSLSKAKTRTVFLRPFDFVHPDLKTSLQTLDAAYEMSLAADDILSGLEPVIFYLAEGESTEAITPSFSSGHRLVELLSLGHSNFVSAQIHLTASQRVINSVSLADVSPNFFISIDQLASFHTMLSDYNQLLLESPTLLTTMLGLDDTKNYLMLSQNSDELRPSGGYISTYGWMNVRNGRIADYFYGPTTETTPNPPSGVDIPFQIPDWWIEYSDPVYAAWDSSWYADYPTTASLAAWYFDNGGNLNEPVDGVIAIDLVGFELILEGLGTVTVPEYGETVTSENFRQVVYAIRAEGAGQREHKKFLAALYYQILADWQAADQAESAALRRAVLQALQEKHIMLYFADETLNQAVDILGWSGKQDAGIDHDYIMVADANINGSKHNRSVMRALTYDVTVQTDGTLQSRLTVAYDYSARVAENDPAIQPEHYTDIDYYGNHQVFVPLNSTLVETNDLQFEPEIVTTETHTEFVSLFRIAYDDVGRFQYIYSTPALVETIGPYHRYKLLLQKQAGMLGETVNVQVSLPEGASTVEVTPDPAASYDLGQPILEFRLTLTHDEWIEIVYTQ